MQIHEGLDIHRASSSASYGDGVGHSVIGVGAVGRNQTCLLWTVICLWGLGAEVGCEGEDVVGFDVEGHWGK